MLSARYDTSARIGIPITEDFGPHPSTLPTKLECRYLCDYVGRLGSVLILGLVFIT